MYIKAAMRHLMSYQYLCLGLLHAISHSASKLFHRRVQSEVLNYL